VALWDDLLSQKYTGSHLYAGIELDVKEALESLNDWQLRLMYVVKLCQACR
jgi:hypothetical protein